MSSRRQRRIACRAVLLDAGGVIVLPDRRLVCAALARAGIDVDPGAVHAAHYRAVRRLEAGVADAARQGYLGLFCLALGVPRRRLGDAIVAMVALADRGRSGEILWSEPAPHAWGTLVALARARVPVVIVSNSDGHAEDNLRDAGICQVGPGRGVPVTAILDSVRVGSTKPDRRIFEAALGCAGARAEEAVHVGDTLSADVVGAVAVGIVPIHLDPTRRCRADHRHVRALNGIWSHLTLLR